jgi:hypothetical protein
LAVATPRAAMVATRSIVREAAGVGRASVRA